ncbi:MAG TPA: class I SAM-dependent methyltransferase [Gemmatimonadales bacterium]
MLHQEYRTMHAQELSHWWFRGRRRLLTELVHRHVLNGRPRPRLLDFGCGTGGNVATLAAMGEVIGLEPDPGAVELARSRGGALYCRGSGTALPFASESFDGVVASDVLEHIGDDSSAVGEILRVLRPGGKLVFTVPAHPWLYARHDAALLHHRRYTRRSLRALIQQSGLRLEWLSYWNAILFPAVCAFRLIGQLRGDTGVQSDIGSTPLGLNEPLTAVLGLEARALRYVPLPWGVSLVGIASRTGSSASS